LGFFFPLKKRTSRFLGWVSPSAVLSRLQVLLVSSSRHPDRWIVPGGGMEPEEEPSVAAVREVCEEVSCFITNLLVVMTVCYF
uniref:Nudix hydrolase 3 n=1 Tax=Nothoprocta perdicaria TaxID=30464 RepID=A0A8C6YXI5_NOTPE